MYIYVQTSPNMHAIQAFSLSFSLQFDDILEFGWQEVNQGTRNLIQKNVSWRRISLKIPPLKLMPNAN